jgi:hypothetical protein
VRIAKENSQALVSLKKYMPPPLPYFKVNICEDLGVLSSKPLLDNFY